MSLLKAVVLLVAAFVAAAQLYQLWWLNLSLGRQQTEAAARPPKSFVRMIHQQYKTADQAQFPYLLWVAFQTRWQQAHPGWTHKMWTDAEEEALIEKELPELLPMYRGIDKSCSDIHFIMRADIASHAVTYVHGGVYADMDSVPVRSLDELVASTAPEVEVILPAQLPPLTVDNDLLIATRPRHPFFRECLLSVQSFYERHRDFVCSFEAPPGGRHHRLEPYFPLLWFAASRRLLLCNGAWRGQPLGMDLALIAHWEDQLAEASRLLPEAPQRAQRLFAEVRDDVFRRQWRPAADVLLPRVVGKGRTTKRQAERKCAGGQSHVLDGRRQDVVECLVAEASQQAASRSLPEPWLVLFDLSDSSWEGSAEERALRRHGELLARLRGAVPGFWPSLGSCATHVGAQAERPPRPELPGHCARVDGDCGHIPGCAWCKVGSVREPEDMTNCLACYDGYRLSDGSRFGDCTAPCIATAASALERSELRAARSEAAMRECAELCSARDSCGAFDLPVLDEGVDPEPQHACRLFGRGARSGSSGPPRLCFAAVRQGPALPSEPFELAAPAPQPEPPAATGARPPSVCFVHYHKTGSELAEGLADALADVKAAFWELRGGAKTILNLWANSWSSRGRSAFAVGEGSRWFDWSRHSGQNLKGLDEMLPHAEAQPGVYTASEPLGAARPPASAERLALVHFLRHPVDQVVSAYHYHLERREWWIGEQGRCNFCAEGDWHAIFGRCGESCSYGDLLQGINASEGVALEFRNQRLTLQTMLHNLQAWRADAAVLPVSLEQFKRDFDGTTACIARFLRLSSGEAARFQEGARSHDLARMREGSSHATSGRRSADDRSSVRRALLESGSFGTQLEAVVELYSAAVRSGVDAYGCPPETNADVLT